MNPDLDRVIEAVESLGEHFDTVHIFVTRYESQTEGTTNLHRGIGNFYARYGQIQEWITRENEQARIDARKANQPPEE